MRARSTLVSHLFIALLALLVAPANLRAQYKELHWRAIAVDARLDSAGTLHVSERQSMTFTGDWNGGERRFNIRVGQRFNLESVSRVDSVSGRFLPLSEGDIALVDRYRMRDRVLRWRSRLPTDPLFANTTITYVINYTIGNLLVPRDSTYVLDHDFIFPERDGEIETFTLHLTVDKAWQTPPDFQARGEAAHLPPGEATYSAQHIPPLEGFVVRLPLRYRLAGHPASVEFGAPLIVRYALAALLLVAVLAFVVRFFLGERAIGRFAPLLDPSTIDEKWLEANVFDKLPEVVGAMWDDTTGSPEVAAVLARMVGEMKLKSEVTSVGWGIFKRDVLHLTLLVDRHSLPEYENQLVAAFFEGHSTTTDTDAVRRRYRSTGFDPSKIIAPALDRLMRVETRVGGKYPKPSKRLTIVLLIAASALLVAGFVLRISDVIRAMPWIIGIIVWSVVAYSQSAVWRARVVSPGPHSLRFLIPIVLGAGAILALQLNSDNRIGSFALAGVTFFFLALVNSVLNIGRSRQPAERISLRKRLAAGREYFKRELLREKPALRDAWYPYFLAFGLGANVDKWFKAFGGDAATMSAIGHSAYASSSLGGSHASSGPSFSGFGGGGAFAGGGSSGSWSSAVNSFASSVSAPSSSSSSGGSSGGGSSGGGGGGGW